MKQKRLRRIITNKKVRKAVRTFLIENNQIVVIKYKTEHNLDYYDIPGGKIEENETSYQASIREFKEETGLKIIHQNYVGNVIIEYPDRIFDMDVYKVDKYEGVPQEFGENYSMWVDPNTISKQDKTFPSIVLIKYLDDNIQLKMNVTENHHILNIEKWK